MTGTLELFRYENQEVRTVLQDNEPWFVAADVCAILGYSHTPHAVRMLDPDEYRQAEFPQVAPNVRSAHPGPPRRPMTLVNEPGLYTLIFRSERPEAKPFRRWVTHEVLPSIRRTGSFGTPPPAIDPVQAVTALLVQAVRQLAAQMPAPAPAPAVGAASLFAAEPLPVQPGLFGEGVPAPTPAPVVAAPKRPARPVPNIITGKTAVSEWDATIRDWVDTRTVPAAPGRRGTRANQLYTRFVDWLGQDEVPSAHVFGVTLTALGYPSKTSGGGNWRPLFVPSPR